MLTVVSHNREKGLKVVKHSHSKDPSIIYEYQVHDAKDTMNPLRGRFSTKTEADECIGVNQKKEPDEKSKRPK